MSRDPRVEAYIDASAEFARPILAELRERVHAACPQAVETTKWGMPTFMYRDAILCSMAAFKQHVSFGFWRHAEVMGEGVVRDGMGSYGRITTARSIPGKQRMRTDIRRAMALTDAGGSKTAGKPRSSKPPAEVPEDLAAALKRNADAHKVFETFPPSAKRDYIEWITEAKREDTRARRLAQAVAWMAEGKRRHWKYENC